MTIIRKSQVSGLVRSRELDVTPDQIARLEAGQETIQDIFPDLSASDREFIKTGITDEEWDGLFEK